MTSIAYQNLRAAYVIKFEGVCFNSCHPGPRRVWKGGSEPQLLTPDPGDPGIWGIRWLRWRVPKSLFWSNAPSLFAKVVLSRDVFLTFADPIPRKTPTFELIFDGGGCPEIIQMYAPLTSKQDIPFTMVQ